MSELITGDSRKREELFLFASGLIDGGNGKKLYETYRHATDNVDAAETMEVFDRLITEGYPVEKVKAYAGKIINIFFRSLSSQQLTMPPEGHFLSCMMQENREMEKHIAAVRPYIRAALRPGSVTEGGEDPVAALAGFVRTAREYELHYIKKENILFPSLEKTFSRHRCLQVMWSFHDDYRRSLKALEMILQSDNPDISGLNTELGKLFFVIIPVIFREERIVYPVALRAIPDREWHDMLEQSREVGWCYGVSPVYTGSSAGAFSASGKINLGTGVLSAEQLMIMLEHLPVDITFVDENDEVCYFSGAKHRIFPRSKAIIGRKVQNCHPPESVHVVNDIVEAFRNGSKDHADFWINMRGRFIHIRYFALRDEGGVYRGTIEVSQDVTEIRGLEGEQRLLDWTM